MMSAVEDAASTLFSRATRARVPVIVGGVMIGSFMVGLAINAINTEDLVSNAFDRTFAALPKPQTSVQVSRSYTGVAGSEDFWLRADGDAGLIKTVSVGQRLLLTTNGASRELTITDVRTSSDEATHIDTGQPGSKLLVITCLDKSSGVEQRLRLRIEGGRLVEVPSRDEPQGSQSARAL